jgi:MFS family permease
MTRHDTPATLRMLPVLAVGAFASQASIRMADPMLPQLAHEFGTRVTDLSGVITAFALAYGVMQIVYGPLADRLGKLRVIGWATAAASLGSAACALATGVDSLTLLRLLTGAACASLIPLALAWIGDNVPYANRQATLARFMIGSTLGIVFGQVAGGLFADTLGWRFGFVLPALVFAGVAWVLLREGERAPGAAPAATQADGVTGASTGAGAAGAPAAALAAFGEVLRSGWARTMLLLVFLEGALNFGVLALMPAWLHERHGLSLWQAGMAAAGYGLGGLGYALLSPWLVPRLGERGLVIAGSTLLCAGMAAVGGPHWPIEALKSLVMGIGFFMLHGTMQTLATQMVPSLRGTAISAFALALFAGQSIGVAIVARASDTVGYELVRLGGAAGMLLLGATLAVLLWRRARRMPGA